MPQGEDKKRTGLRTNGKRYWACRCGEWRSISPAEENRRKEAGLRRDGTSKGITDQQKKVKNTKTP